MDIGDATCSTPRDAVIARSRGNAAAEREIRDTEKVLVATDSRRNEEFGENDLVEIA